MVSFEGPIAFDGREYVGAEKIGVTDTGHFVVCLFSTPPSGPRESYFTVIPISSLFWRDEHPIKARAVRENKRTLCIYSDRDQRYTFIAGSSIIDQIVEECVEFELMKKEEV